MVRIACVAVLALLLLFVHTVSAEEYKGYKLSYWGEHPYDDEEHLAMARGALPKDHFILRLSITRDSKWDTEIASSEYQSSEHTKMRWGPMDVAVKLVPRRHFMKWDQRYYRIPFQGARWRLTQYILIRAYDWMELDREKKYIEKLDELGEDARGYEPYKTLRDAMPDLERRLKAIDAYAEDAQRILRLIQGIVFYEYSDKQQADHALPGTPFSGSVQARFSGGKRQKQHRNTSGTTSMNWGSSEVTAEPWSADDVEREHDWRPFDNNSHVRAIVWRFRPEDMERIRVLIADCDAVKKALFEDGYSGEQTTANAQRHAMYNRRYWGSFHYGLQQIVTFAWLLSPHRPPDGMFMVDPRYRAPASKLNVENWILRPDAPLVLPPISGDTLMRLRLPLKIFRKMPPNEKVLFPEVDHIINVHGQYDYQRQSTMIFSMHCPDCTWKQPSIEAPGDSDTQWTRQRQRENDDTTLFNSEPILVSADTSGAAFRGDYSIVWKIDHKPYDDEVGYRLEDHRYSVGWELVEMGPGIFVSQGAGEGVQP